MADSAMLKRLFGEALGGRSFAEAGDILWHVSRHTGVAPAREFTLISSHQWFDPLKNLRNWTATAWADAPRAREEHAVHEGGRTVGNGDGPEGADGGRMGS